MRYAEKLEQLPVAGKAEEMRLIQVNNKQLTRPLIKLSRFSEQYMTVE